MSPAAGADVNAAAIGGGIGGGVGGALLLLCLALAAFPGARRSLHARIRCLRVFPIPPASPRIGSVVRSGSLSGSHGTLSFSNAATAAGAAGDDPSSPGTLTQSEVNMDPPEKSTLPEDVGVTTVLRALLDKLEERADLRSHYSKLLKACGYLTV